MTVPALEIKNLTKTFPGVKALDRATLTLMPGTVHALMGENGAGKSTLIKVVTGILHGDSGTINVFGENVHFDGPTDAMDAGIGVVHQERNVVRGFTVGENICLSKMPRKGPLVDWPEVKIQAKRCLDMLDLAIDPDTPMTELSAAQTQLVEIARGLYTETRVLLLDEPTASISVDEAMRLFRVIERLKAEGTAILFVSHKLEEVFEHCDSITVLRDGKTVVESQPLAGFTRDEVIDKMVGRALAHLEAPQRSVDMTTVPALALNALSTTAGHRNVSFELRRGEILGLYGLVGAGRTELARSILGLEGVVAGTVKVKGEDVRIRSVREALQKYRIGYVTENRKEEGVFLLQPITTNIAVTVWSKLAKFMGYVPAKDEQSLVAEQVAQLDIKISSQDQMAGQLSGGNQQKVSLAKWLAANTEVLIIDEPTVGIDVRTKRSFYDLIWKLADEGMAILLISSDLSEMITLADRIAVMERFVVRGEIENTHHYEEMSQAVIRLIHPTSTPAAGE
ncbi:sugar ABC transporter ATP-binding protein [Demequina oxidasica]|uniref:sugar ABC transporter ATP-binding protein n=1 Tax=Demequina oxidasica TaxID=676199 RepID=UPI000780B128|nr:sugar ABC transporter ATP-binding protein [Demequina oxidasica]